ncbi:MAG TPA: hypothetical protein VGI98_04605 [Candidatus Limnocylindrales bacterium]|jgi:hypothetical protein
MARPQRQLLTRAAPAAALLVAIGAFAACNPGASTLPSVTLPSITLPSVAIPSIGASLSVTGSGVTGCIDPATAALLSQAQAQGADIPTLLQQNKDALIQGLEAFQPGDPATTLWRDNLVFAIKAGDFTTATQQIQLMASGQVAISSC